LEEDGEKNEKENSQTHAFSSSPNPKKLFPSSAGLTMERGDFILFFFLFFCFLGQLPAEWSSQPYCKGEHRRKFSASRGRNPGAKHVSRERTS
jgi:hypothetical protein